MDQPARLQITGCQSPERLPNIFSSCLVDVAYCDELTLDGVIIGADDPEWPINPQEYNWLCDVIRETLAEHGIRDVGFVLA